MSDDSLCSKNTPDFVCMGFQKCGTTTLYKIFKQHPQVVLCRDVKEPMYYRIPRIVQLIGRGHKFYCSRYFGHVAADDLRLKGEINAGLTFTDCAEKFAKNYPPDVKMIFIMREPVSRCFSSYKYFLAKGFLPAADVNYDLVHGHSKGFDHYVHKVLGDDRKRSKIMDQRLRYLVFSQSNYATCIREYLQYYPKENMRFVIFEEFIQDEHAALRGLYDFIGLDDCEEIDYKAKANEGKNRPSSAFWAECFKIVKAFNYAFYEFFHLNKFAPRFYRVYNSFYKWVKRRCMVRDFDTGGILPETREYIQGYLKEEMEDLEKITERDLSGIWGYRTGSADAIK